jgi:thiosulfate/3-mercaptopyruvate sulfurtransferase
MGANALVDTGWLEEHLSDPDLTVLDGSWYLPGMKRNARAEFEAEHVPGAQFFDVDAIADRSTDLPHMLPPPDEFASAVGALGIGDGDMVVVYDGSGVFSAPRVWWTFRVFGHERIAVLDGGLPKWKREGLPVEKTVRTPHPKRFTARFRPELVRTLEQMKANAGARAEQVIDARSRGRFDGTEPEPRPGLKGGHIPGSRSLPFGELVTKEGTLADIEALRRAFERELDLAKPVVTTCGSGLTASILALGLHRIGRTDAAVYDGSWAEWGGREDTPIEK